MWLSTHTYKSHSFAFATPTPKVATILRIEIGRASLPALSQVDQTEAPRRDRLILPAALLRPFEPLQTDHVLSRRAI